MGIYGTISAIERAGKEAKQDRAAIDERWSFEARSERLGQINAEVTERVTTLRERGIEELGQEEVDLQAKDYKRRLAVGPQGAEGWAEAAARLPFVRLELAGMAAQDVPRAYQTAAKAGDKIGSWLLATEGQRRLEELRESEDESLQKGTAEAAQALQEAAFGALDAKRKKDEKELAKVTSELMRAAAAAMPQPTGRIVQY